MSPKRWLALLAFYISYLFFGASIYYNIEHTEERQQRAQALEDRIKMNEYISRNLIPKDDDTQHEILMNITHYCGKKVTNYTLDEFEDPYRWNFYHSFFFAFTVCSTVGYGNISPSTTLGRMILIAYSLIGMPVNTILFAGLGDYFARMFKDIYARYKEYKMSNDDLYVPRQFGLIATIIFALIPGIFFFIILPSCLFTYFEDWPFSLSIYYSYVTTTTIGFGDYVPTFQPHQERVFGISFIFYQIFIIVWFIFSLGYLLMIMTFITKALRSKRLAALENHLKLNIKATQHRIWHGVTKDVGYLRRILNELYISVKPIYNEPGGKFIFDLPRSASCPDLQMYKVSTPIVSRKRAFSESFDKLFDDDHKQLGNGTPLPRASSDTNLNRIDKQKTFETVNAFRETTNLLAKVVSALANVHQQPITEQFDDTISLNSAMFGAYHGFTDSQILSSELSFPYAENKAIPHRERASSDFFLNPKTIPLKQQNEWTWCGDNQQIQQAINDRAKFNKKNDLYKASFQTAKNDNSVVVNMNNIEEIKPKKPRKFSADSKAFFKKLVPFRKRSGTQDLIKHQRKQSTASVPEEPEKFPNIDDHYSTITGDHSFFKGDRKGSVLPPINNAFGILPNRKTSLDQVSTTRRGSLFQISDQKANTKHISAISTPTKRHESMFSRNAQHRGSLFTTPTYRRGSLFPFQRQNRLRTSSNRSQYEPHDSTFSIPSDQDEDVLENTTIADLIRALEVLHTRAIQQESQHHLEAVKEEKPKKRKNGTATPPNLSPLFTIFSQTEQQSPLSAHNSSIRRSTIFGTKTPSQPSNNAATNSRRSSAFTGSSISESSEQPPKETSKFRRRFSVRPTEIQIPPGKAPPPSVPLQPISSQTALQRRLSLRPSPLAREFSRATPGQVNSRGSTSSTYSPLSRLAQTNARKNSAADTFVDKSEQKDP